MSDYVCTRFEISNLHGNACCGLNTIANLGIEIPYHIKGKYKTDLRVSDMIHILVEHGITMFELSLNGLSRVSGLSNGITHDHVILLCQRFQRNENSWTIAFRDRHYHNNDWRTLQRLEFLNRPIEYAFVLWRQDWSFRKIENPIRGYCRL